MVLPEGTVDTTIIIRSEKVKDIPVECEPSWTVANLKEHLSKTYPGNPVCMHVTRDFYVISM